VAGGFSAWARNLAVQIDAQNKKEAPRLLAAAALAERNRVLREEAQRGGVAPAFTDFVDGRRGAAYQTVAPDGVIRIQYGYAREVALQALKLLSLRSPVLSGDYLKSFVILVNGSAVAGPFAIPAQFDECLIINTQPYARRLELGKNRDGEPFVVQKDPRIVEEVALVLKTAYKDLARVSHTFRELEGGYKLLNSAGKYKGKRRGDPMRYPAIRILRRSDEI
jgi:hypothetical protein